MKEDAILFEYFSNKKDQDIEAISEYIDPIDYPTIGVDDINDMYYLIEFLNKCQNQKEKNDKEYLIWFKNNLLDEEYKDKKDKLIQVLNNLFLKIDIVQELFSKNFDSNEFSKTIIKRMLNNSIIEINFKEDVVKCEVVTIQKNLDDSKDKKEKKIRKKIDEYFNIKEQILLTKKEEGEKKNNKIQDNELFNIFLNIISELEIIIDKYEKIMNKGYFTELYYTITIIDSKLKIINNNQNEIIYLPIDEIINFCFNDNNNEKEIKNFIIKIKIFINELKKNINFILNSNEIIFIKKIKFTISLDFIKNFKDFENIENFKSKFILFYYN
jgi:hypothetical protein